MIPNNIEINALISLSMVIVTASGVWWKMKGSFDRKIDKIDSCMKGLEKKHHADHLVVKEDIEETKIDIKELRIEVREDKNQIIEKIDGIKSEMNTNHIKLLEAINNSLKR